MDLAAAVLGDVDAPTIPVMKQGIVVSVSPLTVTVGASTVAAPCTHLGSYEPVAADVVTVLVNGADRIVLGTARTTPNVVAAGYIGSARFTHIGNISGVTDLTNMQVTFTALAGARYRISWDCCFLQQTAGGTANAGLYDGTNLDYPATTQVAGGYISMAGVIATQPGAGSITYKLRAQTSAGTIAMATPANLLVERIL